MAIKNGQNGVLHALRNERQPLSEELQKILLQCILICYYMTIALVKVLSMGHYSLNSHTYTHIDSLTYQM